jgi:Fibronectin type III domain
MGSTAATITISDTAGNTYTCDGFDCYNSGDDVISNPGSSTVPASKDFVGIWRSSNITGGSSFKVTATIGGSNTGNMTLIAAEFTGLGTSVAFDGSLVHNANAGTANPSTGSFSTTNAHDLIVIGCCGSGTGSNSVSAPSGYTTWSSKSAALGYAGMTNYAIAHSTQASIDPTWTTTGNSNNVAIAIAYQAASAAPAPSAPASLTVTAIGSTTVSLAWPQGSGTVTDNQVEQARNPAFVSGSTNDLGSAQTSTTITGLSANTWYFFRVNAGNSGSFSGWSNFVAAYTGGTSTFSGQIPLNNDGSSSGWTNTGGAASFTAALTDLSTATYAASPSASTSPLVIDTIALPASLGTPTSVLFIVEEMTSSSTGNPLTLTLVESNGSTQIAQEAIPGSTSIGWESATASLTPLAYSAQQILGSQLQIALTSTSNGTANVYEAQVYVAYDLAGDVGNGCTAGPVQASGLVGNRPFAVMGGAGVRSRTW